VIPAIAPPPGDVLGLKERNIDDWWSPADDPSYAKEVEHTCTKGTGGGATGSNAQQVDHQPVFQLVQNILFVIKIYWCVSV